MLEPAKLLTGVGRISGDLSADEQIRVDAHKAISDAIAQLTIAETDNEEWLTKQAQRLGRAIASGHAAFMTYHPETQAARSTSLEPCESE